MGDPVSIIARSVRVSVIVAVGNVAVGSGLGVLLGRGVLVAVLVGIALAVAVPTTAVWVKPTSADRLLPSLMRIINITRSASKEPVSKKIGIKRKCLFTTDYSLSDFSIIPKNYHPFKPIPEMVGHSSSKKDWFHTACW
jgi:hypothetical protein